MAKSKASSKSGKSGKSGGSSKRKGGSKRKGKSKGRKNSGSESSQEPTVPTDSHYFTRITAFSDAEKLLVEAYNLGSVVALRPRSHHLRSVYIAGTASVEYVYSGNIDEARRRGRTRSRLGERSDSDDEPGDAGEGDKFTPAGCDIASEDAAEKHPGAEKMPSDVADIFAQMKRRTQRLKRAASHWGHLFSPIIESCMEASGAGDQAAVANLDEPPPPRLHGSTGALHGSGHPIMHYMKHVVHNLAVDRDFAKAVDMAHREYLLQCQFSSGIGALRAALSIIGRLIQNRSHTGVQRRDSHTDGLRAEHLASLKPSLKKTVSRACATRSDSPDIVCLHHGNRQPLLPLSSGVSGADLPVREQHQQLEQTLSPTHPFESTVDANATQSALNGERREQFWDEFFAYRQIGKVSRAKLAVSGPIRKAAVSLSSSNDHTSPASGMSDSRRFGRGRLSPLSRTLHPDTLSRTLPVEALSSFQLPTEGAQTSPSSFPSLTERRTQPLQAALRRPPAATAMPLSARRATRALGDGAKLPIITQPLRGDTPESSDSGSTPRRRQIKPVLPTPAKEDLTAPHTLPMFMRDVVVPPEIENRHIPPFENHGISFKRPVPILPSLERAPNEQLQQKAPTFNAFGTRSRASSKELVHRGRPPMLDVGHGRCAYCRFHNLEARPGSSKPLAAAERQRRANLRQERATLLSPCSWSLGDITGPECAACGGDLDAQFIPPQVLPKQETDASSVSESLEATSTESSDEITEASSENDDTDDVAAAEEISKKEAEAANAFRASAVAFGPPRKQPLNVRAGVYFLNCERINARASAHAAAALMEPAQESPRHGRFSGTDTVLISMRNAKVDDLAFAAFFESFAQKEGDFAGRTVHVDVSGNSLSDVGVQALLRRIENMSVWGKSLEVLDISRNHLLSSAALDPLIDLVALERFPRLACLRLGGIEFSDAFAHDLFHTLASVEMGPLQELDLSYTGLGKYGHHGPLAAATLVQHCIMLQVLDLSGNHLQARGCADIGKAIASLGETAALHTLHLAHNFGGWYTMGEEHFGVQDYRQARMSDLTFDTLQEKLAAPFSPSLGSAMCHFCEYVPHLQSVRLLDLRDSQIDPRCAFILARGLQRLSKLEVVLLNSNPLGDYGVRALLSLAVLAKSDASSEAAAAQQGLRLLTLDPLMEESLISLQAPHLRLSDPSGSYTLDLRDPWARAVADYCLKEWALVRNRVPFENAFVRPLLNGKTLKDPSTLLEEGFPVAGTLTFTFLLPAPKQLPPLQSGLETEIIRPHERHRRKLTPELEQLALHIASSCCFSTLTTVVRCLSADFSLSTHAAKVLCSWLREMGPSCLAMQRSAVQPLLESVGCAAQDLSDLDLLAPAWVDFCGWFRTMPAPAGDARTSLDFLVAGNPTGHYRLNLACPSEFLAAEHLLAANEWETELAKSKRLPDVSQKGNYQCLRNESLDGEPFEYRPEWPLPASGLFEFHMALPNRPMKSSKVISDAAWNQMMEVLSNSKVPALARVMCLRRASPSLVVNCQQALAAMKALCPDSGGKKGKKKKKKRKKKKKKGGKQRLPQASDEALPEHVVRKALFSVLVFRIKDFGSIREVFFEGDGPFAGRKEKENLHEFQTAFGQLNLLDPARIDTDMHILNLDLHEDRQICRCLLNIVFEENKRKPFTKGQFVPCKYGQKGQTALRTLHVVPAWWAEVDPPLHGALTIKAAAAGKGDKGRDKIMAKYIRM